MLADLVAQRLGFSAPAVRSMEKGVMEDEDDGRVQIGNGHVRMIELNKYPSRTMASMFLVETGSRLRSI